MRRKLLLINLFTLIGLSSVAAANIASVPTAWFAGGPTLESRIEVFSAETREMSAASGNFLMAIGLLGLTIAGGRRSRTGATSARRRVFILAARPWIEAEYPGAIQRRAVSALGGVVAIGVVGLMANPSLAIPVGPPDQAPGSFFSFDESPLGEIHVGQPGSPLVVEYDPNFGPMAKTLNIQGDRNVDGVIDLADLAALSMTGIAVYEYLEVGSTSPAWTEWHEEILTPGWQWGPTATFYANGNPVGSVNNFGTEIRFDFSSLIPGTAVEIQKQLLYTGGASGFPLGLTQATLGVQVLEYPAIPEPSTAVLFGVGLAALGLGRKSKSR